ncbi:unnamed protein product [Rhizoctonia solani]|uniref:Glutamine synthetase n=1 Tax=Rhizoctonia solani TaxID=456999 RepID=A0A8H3DEA4_9AGAM|nr:unnamed protein product [Rhizoctonia solani]
MLRGVLFQTRALEIELLAPYLKFDQGNSVQAEYVWIDGDDGLCSKIMLVHLNLAAIFCGGKNILVLAETYNNNGTPNHTNYHHHVQKIMDLAKDKHPRFGLKQEYTLFDADGTPYGTGKVFVCDLIQVHYHACLYAGIKISGIDAKVMPLQWEFQVRL